MLWNKSVRIFKNIHTKQTNKKTPQSPIDYLKKIYPFGGEGGKVTGNPYRSKYKRPVNIFLILQNTSEKCGLRKTYLLHIFSKLYTSTIVQMLSFTLVVLNL